MMMGCDIHVHAEVRIEDTWHHYAEYEVDRDYLLFARMAGVRNRHEIEPIAAPRGLPHDISAITRIDARLWDGDGHSHSWLTLQEVGELTEWAENMWSDTADGTLRAEPWGWLFGGYWSTYCGGSAGESLPEPVSDARLVFWFDN